MRTPTDLFVRNNLRPRPPPPPPPPRLEMRTSPIPQEIRGIGTVRPNLWYFTTTTVFLLYWLQLSSWARQGRSLGGWGNFFNKETASCRIWWLVYNYIVFKINDWLVSRLKITSENSFTVNGYDIKVTEKIAPIYWCHKIYVKISVHILFTKYFTIIMVKQTLKWLDIVVYIACCIICAFYDIPGHEIPCLNVG